MTTLRLCNPSDIAKSELFSNIFPIQAGIADALQEHIREKGFDSAHPLVLGSGPWTQHPVLIDGHSRLQASIDVQCDTVPVVVREFETEDDAVAYVIHSQKNRRNLSDADITRLIGMFDERWMRGRPQTTKNSTNEQTENEATGPETTKTQKKQIVFMSRQHQNEKELPPCGGNSSQRTAGKQVEKELPQRCGNFQGTNTPRKRAETSATHTARVLNISPRKVEQARTVLAHADADTHAAVFSGTTSINKAYTKTQADRKAAAQRGDGHADTGTGTGTYTITGDNTSHKDDNGTQRKNPPTFNATNDNIEWAKWSWNPVTGCKHECQYCYARDIAMRFEGSFEPRFRENRLSAPPNTKLPQKAETDIGYRNVFVCSMSDLFGEWVPQTWIDAVMDACRNAPQWNFLFLTKNPKRLPSIDFPLNAWVGTTVDTQARVAPAIEAFRNVNATVKFLSCEPLLEQLDFPDMSMFDWIIIGGQSKSTRDAEKQPKWPWVESLTATARKFKLQVYWKPNLLIRPKEYPELQRGTAVETPKTPSRAKGIKH